MSDAELDAAIVATERLYANPRVGVRWETPGEDWRFTEFPPGMLGEGSIQGLTVLLAPDRETTFPLAYLSFRAEGLGAASADVASDPDTFFEQATSALPEEAAESAERTEVAGAPALRMKLQQDGIRQILYLILRPNGAFYLFAQSPREPDPAVVEAGIAGLTFTPPRTLPTPTPEPTPASPEAQRDQIIAAVEQLRELRTTRPVPFEFLDRAALRAKIEQDLEEETGRDELAASDRIYKLLGLIPANADLTDLLVELYTSQVAGFYEPEEDRFYLVSSQRDGLLSVMDRVTFAHEYVHALQDQHYDLEALRDEKLGLTDDQEDAVRAIVEGDAQAVTSLYVVSKLSRTDLEALVSGGAEFDQETLEHTPRFLRESLVFPYIQGLAFIQTRLQIGGWDAVDALYRATPQSTEQILHPERYPDDSPQAVTLPRLALTPDDTWTERYRETWGEFGLRLLLEEQLPAEQSERAAEGWDGDQYFLLQDGAGNDLFVLEIVWDTGAEAAEFTGTAREWLERAGYQEAAPGRFQSDDQTAALLLNGNRTILTVADRAANVTPVLAALERQGG